jgi:hypothetical protein
MIVKGSLGDMYQRGSVVMQDVEAEEQAAYDLAGEEVDDQGLNSRDTWSRKPYSCCHLSLSFGCGFAHVHAPSLGLC